MTLEPFGEPPPRLPSAPHAPSGHDAWVSRESPASVHQVESGPTEPDAPSNVGGPRPCSGPPLKPSASRPNSPSAPPRPGGAPGGPRPAPLGRERQSSTTPCSVRCASTPATSASWPTRRAPPDGESGPTRSGRPDARERRPARTAAGSPCARTDGRANAPSRTPHMSSRPIAAGPEDRPRRPRPPPREDLIRTEAPSHRASRPSLAAPTPEIPAVQRPEYPGLEVSRTHRAGPLHMQGAAGPELPLEALTRDLLRTAASTPSQDVLRAYSAPQASIADASGTKATWS